MNTKKHGKVTMALAMIGGLAALSIAYAAISTQLNIQTGEKTEKVEAAADVKFTNVVAYGVSKVENGKVTAGYETEEGKETSNDAATCADGEYYLKISGTNKEADTVTINGTVLRDYGAFAVYQLTIENEGSTAVKLMNDPNSKSVTDFTITTDSAIKNNITIGVYSDADCTEKVLMNNTGTSTDKLKGNYIPAKSDSGNGSTTWYVKVAHRVHGEEEYNGSNPTANVDVTDSSGTTHDITSGEFGFTITPVWENV
ncbi:MAG: hypothetical protein Q4B84_00835 [Clostridia bacterium]|nr:hypothetical protein [Clostridia bacterium]